jgi:WD40 repeat protein
MGEPTVWSAASGSQVSSYSGYPGFQESAFWSPREDLILSDDVIWNGLTGKMIRSYASGNLQGHFFEVSSWSPNGTEIASVEPGGQIVVWDAATGATIWQGQGNLGAVSLSWSPNGQYIAWVSDEQSEAGILNSKTGSPVTTFGNNSLVGQGVGSTSSSISWSPDAKYIATVNNGEIQMWQAPNWSY